MLPRRSFYATISIRATLILILDVNLGNACKVPNGGRNVEQSSGLGMGSLCLLFEFAHPSEAEVLSRLAYYISYILDGFA